MNGSSMCTVTWLIVCTRREVIQKTYRLEEMLGLLTSELTLIRMPIVH